MSAKKQAAIRHKRRELSKDAQEILEMLAGELGSVFAFHEDKSFNPAFQVDGPSWADEAEEVALHLSGVLPSEGPEDEIWWSAFRRGCQQMKRKLEHRRFTLIMLREGDEEDEEEQEQGAV
jgi:hypothetical protein